MLKVLETLVTIFGDEVDSDGDTFILVSHAQFNRNFGPFATGEEVHRLRLSLLGEELWLEELVQNGDLDWDVRRQVRVQLGLYNG